MTRVGYGVFILLGVFFALVVMGAWVLHIVLIEFGVLK